MSQLGQGAPWGFPVCLECETQSQNIAPGSSELLLSAVEILSPSFASGWSPPHTPSQHSHSRVGSAALPT